MKKVFLIFVCCQWVLGYDPFYYKKSEVEILGIMPNKVNLNGKWIAISEEFNGFYVVRIQGNCAVLKYDDELQEYCLVKKGKFL